MPNYDSGPLTLGNLPTILQEPKLILGATATNAASASVITYTTDAPHNLVLGAPVIISGFYKAEHNFDPASGFGAGRPAQVASIVSSTSFTVKSISTVATASAAAFTASATGGTNGGSTATVATTNVVVGMSVSGTGVGTGARVQSIGTGTVTLTVANTAALSGSTLTFSWAGSVKNDSLVTNLPWNQMWLSTTGANIQVAREWGNTNPIQPDDDRGTGARTLSTVTQSGNSFTFSVSGGHGLSVGDRVVITGTPKGCVDTPTEIGRTYPTTDYRYPVNGLQIPGLVVQQILNSTDFTVVSSLITGTAAAGFTDGNLSSGIVQKLNPIGGGSGDKGWKSTYTVPSGKLDKTLDNHDRVLNADSGYPAYTPKYTVPNIVGLTTTNAIQKIRANGLIPGFVQFSSDLTVTAAVQEGTGWKFTTGSVAHNLSVGDTVNLSGGTSGAVANNLGDVVVGAVSGYTFTIKNVVGTTAVTTLVARPKNTVVSAQAVAAGTVLTGDTDTLAVGFTRNYGL